MHHSRLSRTLTLLTLFSAKTPFSVSGVFLPDLIVLKFSIKEVRLDYLESSLQL